LSGGNDGSNIFFLVGVLLGSKCKKVSEHDIYKKIQALVMFLLLIVMGITIGSNKTLFMNIDTIGVKALVLAMFTSIGAVVFTYTATHRL
jgi:hypothetical protein